MDDIPWKAIIMVGGATAAIGLVALLGSWLVPYVQGILPG